jgi:hypothetical protein
MRAPSETAMPKTPLKKPTQAAIDLRAHELRILNGAAYWTAFIQAGPGDRRRSEAPTQDGAIAAGVELLGGAPHKHKAMIYAVAAAGEATLAGTVDRAGVFKSALTPAGAEG